MLRMLFLAWVTGLFSIVTVITSTAQAAEEVTIYRDVWGVPNIYGDSEEAVCYALGYAQAEDRPEQIFNNYRRAVGRLAEIEGDSALEFDFYAKVFRFEEVCKANWDQVSPKVRSCMTAFQQGVRRYFKDHPDKVPDSHLEIEPWMCVALGRAVIWGWPLGQAGQDLVAGGLDPPKLEYRGSNQMVLAPSRTKDEVAIAVIDPHLDFYGMMRFYEARMYGGEIAVAGVTVTGLPFISLALGHNAYVSISMTTGGPDTSDIFKETLHPENDELYLYEGEWREGERRRIEVDVKNEDGTIGKFTRDILYTHHGPVIAEKDGFGYAAALPYTDEVGLPDQMYRIFTAKNLDEVKEALAMARLMPQNVMVTTVDGDIYYQRTGRVPIRPEGFNYDRPVDGHLAATEWKGIHPTADLVQIENPSGGWMQNCNVSPRVMFPDSPLTEDKYKGYIYVEPKVNGLKYGLHQRAKMTFEQLDKLEKASTEDVFEIALSPQVYGVEPWQAKLRNAWERADDEIKSDPELAKFVDQILNWDGRAEKDSTGIIPYRFWKDQQGAFGREVGNRLGSPPGLFLTNGAAIKMAQDGCQAMIEEHGRVDVEYGQVYRCGRKGGQRTAPAEGGSVDGVATPRALSFGEDLEGGQQLMTGGQCAFQIAVMSQPPQSWTVSPLGQSDDPTSPHFDDQAIELVSNRKLKSTYFQDRAALMKELESTTKLVYPE